MDRRKGGQQVHGYKAPARPSVIPACCEVITVDPQQLGLLLALEHNHLGVEAHDAGRLLSRL